MVLSNNVTIKHSFKQALDYNWFLYIIYLYFVPVSWINIGGSLTQIDNGLTTDIWGVDSNHYIFRLRENNTWDYVSGWLKHVSTGNADVLFEIFHLMQVLMAYNWRRKSLWNL